MSVFYCDIEKDGTIIRYDDTEGDVDYYEVSMGWIISSIDTNFFTRYVNLCDETSEIVEEMEYSLRIVELLYGTDNECKKS